MGRQDKHDATIARKVGGRVSRSALTVGICALLATSSLNPAAAQATGASTVSSPVTTVAAPDACARVPAPFTGVEGRLLTDSKEAWPKQPRPAPGAPNVLIWLIDDAGFGLLSAFGGLADTPNLDRLAAHGLRYTNFHSTPLCSPSRAALLTGRNAHSVHMGSHGGTSMGFPGYDGFVPPTAATTAKVLREQGYSTVALGKWDSTPFKQLSPSGPFDLWPSGLGFEHFYGFMWHDSDHYHPTLVEDNTILTAPAGDKDYFLTTDLANRAISHINGLKAAEPDRPFYMYWATGAVHSPHQATEEWRAKYRGRFDMGWDAYRTQVLKRQKAMGITPANAQLAPLQPELPAWNTLKPDEKKVYARQMEVIAAQISQTDYEFGRIVDTLKRNGQFDNTIIVVTSDNGASPEGGPQGAYMETAHTTGYEVGVRENLKHFDEWGGPSTMPHYSAAWAVAANTPYRYYKQSAHEGGHHVPAIVSWPKVIKSPGLRTQYAHLMDISPTVLDAAGIAPPACVDGVPQQQIEGIALNPTFTDPNAADRRQTQYYELWGNRGIYHDGWKAVVLHKREAWNIQAGTPFENDKWELYDLRSDPGEARDLAARRPDKLAELQKLFEEEAKQHHVYPLADLGARNQARVGQRFQAESSRSEFDYPQPGLVAASAISAAPIGGRSYTLKAVFTAKPTDEGVVIASGGVEAGFALYLQGGKLHYDYNEFGLEGLSLADAAELGSGETTVEMRWTQENRDGGTMAMVVNGREVARGRMKPRVYGTFGSNELFNIGRDTGAPASKAYQAPFAFTGAIKDVKLTFPK